MRSNSRRLLMLALLFVSLGLPASAQTLVYYVDASKPNYSGSGLSWAAAKQTLQEAIDATTSPHQVWVKAGTYAEAITLRSGVSLYGGFASNATKLTERDPKANPTIIDGSTFRPVKQPAYHVVTMSDISNAGLNGFVITGGKASYSNPMEYEDRNHGGGIFCKNLTGINLISECVIRGNSAYFYGGGLYADSSSLTVSKCSFQENSGYEGGGVYCLEGNVQLTGCAICANTGRVAAGLYAEMENASSLMKVHECTIAANYIDNGLGSSIDYSAGGAYLYGSNIATTIELANCLITGNEAPGVGGVMIGSGWERLIHCTIVNNTSQLGLCGGMLITGTAAPQIYNTIFAGNHPYSIYEKVYDGDPRVMNCLFYSDASATGDYYDENATCYRGAAAINAIPDKQATNNVDGSPRFIMSPCMGWTKASTLDYTAKRFTFTNDQAKWRPGELVGRLILPDINRKGVGLVIDNTTTTIVAAGLPYYNYSVTAGTKWQFVDYRLGYGSPAIDTGTEAYPYTLNYDILGNLRPTGIPGLGGGTSATSYDIGAYEAIIDGARLRLTPDGDSIDFGTVDIIDGPTPPRSITLTNVGFKPLNFSTPGFRIAGNAAADFTTTTNVATTPMNPGTTRTLSLTFDPTTTGTKTASLLINTNDIDRPVTTITLTGQAIIPKATFIKNPSTKTVDPGTSVTFSAAATGRAPLTYQWQFKGTPLVDGPRVSGAHTTTLTLTGLTSSDGGAYTCVVTTPVGYATSRAAYLYFYPRIHIVSPYGQTTPVAGDYICRNYSFSVTMNTPTVAGPTGTQYVCTGWNTVGADKYNSSGTWMTASLCPSADTTVTWTWKTQHYLTTVANPSGYGSVTPAPGWYDAGRTVTVEARPAPWCALNNWSGSTAGTVSLLQVTMNAPQTLTANFIPQPGLQGAVNINVWPLTTAWSLRDNKGRLVQKGTGKAKLAGVPFGSVTLAWAVPAGYEAPSANPVTQVLTPGGEVSFVEVLRPSADSKERKVGNILRYLLGLTTDPTGLDQNADAKVSIADLLQANK